MLRQAFVIEANKKSDPALEGKENVNFPCPLTRKSVGTEPENLSGYRLESPGEAGTGIPIGGIFAGKGEFLLRMSDGVFSGSGRSWFRWSVPTCP